MQVEGYQAPLYPAQILRGLIKESLLFVLVVAGGLVTLAAGFDDVGVLVQKYWIVFLLAVFAATIANATAVGGGFVFMPLFSFGYGFGPVESLKLALATQAFGMSSGAMSWSVKRIRGGILLFSLIFALAGMAIGSYWIRPDIEHIHVMFGVVSILLAILIQIELRLSSSQSWGDAISSPSASGWLLFGGLCFVGGLITSWVSIGIGEVVAIWMLLRCRYPLVICVATGVAALAICSIVGFIIHMDLGGIRWEILAFTAPGVMLGGRYGGKLGLLLARQNSRKTGEQSNGLRYLIVGVIAIDGIAVLLKSVIQG